MSIRAHCASRNVSKRPFSGVLGACTLCVFAGVFVAGLTSGCGYQFTVAGSGPTIGGPLNKAPVRWTQVAPPRLAIQAFDHRSSELTLGLKYTEYFQRAFAAGSGARIVSSTAAADFLLRGTIESVSAPSLTFTRSATFESRAVVTVRVTVQDLRTNQVVWTQRGSGSSEFFVTNDLQFNRVLQRRAMEQAGEQVASDLAARFLAYLEFTASSPHPSAPSRSRDSAESDDPKRKP